MRSRAGNLRENVFSQVSKMSKIGLNLKTLSLLKRCLKIVKKFRDEEIDMLLPKI